MEVIPALGIRIFVFQCTEIPDIFGIDIAFQNVQLIGIYIFYTFSSIVEIFLAGIHA